MRKMDLAGRRFGLLEVLRPAPAAGGRASWVVRCACGSPERPVRAECLTRGKTTSCGCARRARAAGLQIGSRGRALASGRITRLPRGWAKAWHNLAASARRAGVPWSLTEAQFAAASAGPCLRCGAAPAPRNPLTRLDRAAGWEEGNVAPACPACRRALTAQKHEYPGRLQR